MCFFLLVFLCYWTIRTLMNEVSKTFWSTTRAQTLDPALYTNAGALIRQRHFKEWQCCNADCYFQGNVSNHPSWPNKRVPSPANASRSDHLSQVTSSALNNTERESKSKREKGGKRTQVEKVREKQTMKPREIRKWQKNKAGGYTTNSCYNLIMTKLDFKQDSITS